MWRSVSPCQKVSAEEAKALARTWDRGDGGGGGRDGRGGDGGGGGGEGGGGDSVHAGINGGGGSIHASSDGGSGGEAPSSAFTGPPVRRYMLTPGLPTGSPQVDPGLTALSCSNRTHILMSRFHFFSYNVISRPCQYPSSS